MRPGSQPGPRRHLRRARLRLRSAVAVGEEDGGHGKACWFGLEVFVEEQRTLPGAEPLDGVGEQVPLGLAEHQVGLQPHAVDLDSLTDQLLDERNLAGPERYCSMIVMPPRSGLSIAGPETLSAYTTKVSSDSGSSSATIGNESVLRTWPGANFTTPDFAM